jgi:hypothetical protein
LRVVDSDGMSLSTCILQAPLHDIKYKVIIWRAGK